MNEREVAELRRRFKADKSNITHVCGCYVNENKEVISEFDQSLATLSEEESEKLLSILRRTLSGALGRNLLDITRTGAVVLPPVISCYSRPESVAQMLRHLTGKILDLLDIDAPDFSRWEGMRDAP